MHQPKALRYIMWIILSWGIAELIKRYQPTWIDWAQRTTIASLSLSLPIAFLLFFMVLAWAIGINIKALKNFIEEPFFVLFHLLFQIVIKPIIVYSLSSIWFYGLVLHWQPKPVLLTTQVMVLVLIGSSTSGLMVRDVFDEHQLKNQATLYSLLMMINAVLLTVFFVPLVNLFHLLNERGIVNPFLHGQGRIKPFTSRQLYLSLGLYVLLPILTGIGLRLFLEKRKGVAYIEQKVLPRVNGLRPVGFLILLSLLFSVQSSWTWLTVLEWTLALVPLLFSWLIIAILSYIILPKRYSQIVRVPLIWSTSSFFFELVLGIQVGWGLTNVNLLIPILALILEGIVESILNRFLPVIKKRSIG